MKNELIKNVKEKYSDLTKCLDKYEWSNNKIQTFIDGASESFKTLVIFEEKGLISSEAFEEICDIDYAYKKELYRKMTEKELQKPRDATQVKPQIQKDIHEYINAEKTLEYLNISTYHEVNFGDIMSYIKNTYNPVDIDCFVDGYMGIYLFVHNDRQYILDYDPAEQFVRLRQDIHGEY